MLVTVVVIILGLIAIQSTMFVGPHREINIEVDGSPGQPVVASFDVDGKRHKESRALPTDFSFEASNISFAVIPERDPSESHVTVKAYLGGKHILSCRDSNGVKRNVTASSLLGLGSNNTGIGGIRPEEIASLR